MSDMPKWVRQESCSECDGDGCNNCTPTPQAPAELLRDDEQEMYDWPVNHATARNLSKVLDRLREARVDNIKLTKQNKLGQTYVEELEAALAAAQERERTIYQLASGDMPDYDDDSKILDKIEKLLRPLPAPPEKL